MKNMNMNKGMKYAKSTKKGKAGDDMMNMDAKPMKKIGGGSAIQYASGGSVQCRGNGMARGKKTLIR